MARWVWSEQVRDTRLPGGWERRLDSRAGWRLRRWLSPVQPLGWLATGTPPSRIGYGPGPVTALRRRGHNRQARQRPIRLCLLQGPLQGSGDGPRFGPVTAYWINERSRAVHAVVDDPAGADVVWVHAQDPLRPAVREQLAARLRALPAGVPVLNRLDSYDAYHRDDTFPRLAAAGVSVPDPFPRRGDLVVVKGPGQMSVKSLRRFAGPLPAGHRAFGYVDGRGPDGRHRRYRAFHLLGTVHAGDVLAGEQWQIGLGTAAAGLAGHEPTFAMTAHEQQQVRRIGQVLGLDWFCVDFVRRACDGQPVFTDINVYPTPVVAEQVDARLGARGRWHFLDTAARLGVAEPQGPFWPRFDAAMTALVGSVPAPLVAPAPDLREVAACRS